MGRAVARRSDLVPDDGRVLPGRRYTAKSTTRGRTHHSLASGGGWRRHTHAAAMTAPRKAHRTAMSRRSGFSRDRARSAHAQAGAPRKPTRHTGKSTASAVKPPVRPGLGAVLRRDCSPSHMGHCDARFGACATPRIPAVHSASHSDGSAAQTRATQPAAPPRTSRLQALPTAPWQGPAPARDQVAEHVTVGSPPGKRVAIAASAPGAGFSPPTPAHCGTCAATAPRPATRPDAS